MLEDNMGKSCYPFIRQWFLGQESESTSDQRRKNWTSSEFQTFVHQRTPSRT